MHFEFGDISGVWYGLGAAGFQSLSYVCSRMFSERFHRSTVGLLVLSHILMGLFGVAVLGVMWADDMPRIGEYILPMTISVVGYLFGQTFLFMSLKRATASSISPLLGLKILFVAVVCTLFYGKSYGQWQWVAVVVSVCAAVMLKQAGGMTWRSVGLVLLMCLGYCFSDIYIRETMSHFKYLGVFRGSVLCAGAAYILCGVMSVFFLPMVHDVRGMWKYAIPFAATWFVAMVFLFACFAQIGVVHGNVVQSSRGIISIVLGWLIAQVGLVHLENRVGISVVARRICAAILMVCAIALFELGAR